MTEPPARGQFPSQEGSHEQAIGAAPAASSRQPDCLCGSGTSAAATAEAPGGSRPWFVDPERLDVIDSTNRYVVDRASQGAAEGLSVVADRQTAGRGRLQREWVDVAHGSVLCSMLFRPPMAMDRWHLVSLLVALAGLDACADAAGVEAVCKWPNDLVVEGRKIGGILAEVVPPPASAPAGTGAALVVGIGLNCNWGDALEGAPVAMGSMVTSLDRVAGRPVDREAVTARLLGRVAQRYAALTAGAGTPGGSPERSLVAEYRRKLDTMGRVVRVELVDEVFTGRALDVNDAGHLLVDVGTCVRTVEAGDIVHLR